MDNDRTDLASRSSSEVVSDGDTISIGVLNPYSFEKVLPLPDYEIIKRADIITRPDGLFILVLFGKPISDEFWRDSRLLFSGTARNFRLSFRRYGRRHQNGRYMPTKDFYFADINLIESQAAIFPVLKAHKWFDVLLVRSGVEAENMVESDVQNFIACVAK